MLKWTVLSRRETDPKTTPPPSDFRNGVPIGESLQTPRQKNKRRRSSTSRRQSTAKRCSIDNKENQFHSTPIKNSPLTDGFSPFRDLSNLSPKFTVKKKKECLEEHRVSDGSNYFRPFEAVDSHIESVLAEEICSCKKEPSKPKIFSFGIAVGASDGQRSIRASNELKVADETPRMSPLVRKFLDIRFSRVNIVSELENSSLINDMSLDKLVDALMESSSHVQNDLNQTKEENILNYEQERRSEVHSEASSDSGFKSSTSHGLENNFLCKCNNNDYNTIIQINETFNERCVDVEYSRKRPSTTPDIADDERKKIKLTNNDCTLKRQRCIRRRKAEHLRQKLSKINDSNIESATVPPFWSTHKLRDDESLTPPLLASNIDEKTPFRGCYLENKGILSGETASDHHKIIRKCLLFDSPRVSSDSLSSFADSTVSTGVTDIRGRVDLRIFSNEEAIFVNVIRCSDLFRNGEPINAYVKVSIGDRLMGSSRSKKKTKKNAVLQRTAVQGDSSRPIFYHTFRFSKVLCAGKKRIHVEVWHRDRIIKSSEFLGCMSFDVEDACTKVIEGSYKLLPPAEGRIANSLVTNDLIDLDLHQVTMGENNQEGESVIEEILSLDGVETELKRSTNKAILSEQQKYADEHLFLRYLELDPLEGPDAIPAALQRKATGNKFGRTPFTQTKRLVRPAKSGFGFSVVWTHPPRIERVEKGLPAERAGILPGDYIIFVDKHNVVMTPEIDILNLIRSYGSQLTLEIFRRNPSRNGSVPSVHQKSTTIVTPTSIRTDSNVNLPSSATLRRPSTVCSTNTASVDYRRRKLNLPQVTFSSEKATTNPEEIRKRTMYQLIGKEQQYATALQFAITRFVSALAERRDLISPSEHKTLFQNSEEILRITEDILDHLVHEDGEMDTAMLARVYRAKLHEITAAYKKYCSGIKRADCVLANKTKNCNSDFVRFVQCPAIPRRRPDITTFIHKPLEHYREVLKILMSIQSHTTSKHEDFPVINQIVHEMQVTYREITSEGGLMEPSGEGRPLLSVQDLENRLVFTKCKPFVLNKPGRQWIFGGDLSRVEGRTVRQYWTLLFSDLLLFAKASRDRVLFITEDPLPLAHITDMYFSIRKKETEFRICVNSDAQKQASSPTIHCGPDLSRTPRKNSNKKTVILRAPTTELKAVWQNLLQRQIFQFNAGTDGSALSSPMDSPEVPINSSFQSVETSSFRRQQPPPPLADNNNERIVPDDGDVKKQLETLIEHKCKQMSKSSFNGKCNAIHLEQWMKGQLDSVAVDPVSPVVEQVEEEWTEERLRKRSEELQLIDCKEAEIRQTLEHFQLLGNITSTNKPKRPDSTCEELVLSDQDEHSPSKSTTTESQVTVRSSPIVPETVLVCRQCHKNCISNVLANKHHHKDCNSNQNEPISNPETKEEVAESDWQGLVLLGICTSPVANLVNYPDPFRAQLSPPQISVAPPTPEHLVNSDEGGRSKSCMCRSNGNCKVERVPSFDQDISPDDSPQTEEHPYHSLSSSVHTLRRFGTVSSLERCGSEERTETFENHCSSEGSDEDDESVEEDDYLGIDNEGFNHSSIMRWTARAGSYVAQKMAFFEKLGEDYRSGAGLFERYNKPSDDHINGEEAQEEETSGATSGEEVWGTPTSGGDLDDPPHSPNSPNFEGKLSPNNGSYSSDNQDDTEIMMDELLMAPPITGAILRGLLPRRTLEPLIEEDFSDSSSTTSSSDPMSPQSNSSEQDIRSGSAADICSRDVAELARSESSRPRRSSTGSAATSPEETAHDPPTTASQSLSSEWEEAQRDCAEDEGCCVEANDSPTAHPSPSMPRSESYRKIVEAAEDAILEAVSGDKMAPSDPSVLFDNFRPAVQFANNVPRTKSIRILEFFNVRRTERRIYEKIPENRQVRIFSSGNDVVPGSYSPGKVSPKLAKDNRNGRFWRQLSRRRTTERTTNPA